MKHFSLKQQAGASITGVVMFIIMIGILAKLGLGVVPAYITDFQVTKLVKQELKQANANRLTEKQFLADLNQQFSINAAYNLKAEEIITFTNKTPGTLSIKLSHTSESVFYKHTSIVNRFEKEITAADAAAVKD